MPLREQKLHTSENTGSIILRKVNEEIRFFLFEEQRMLPKQAKYCSFRLRSRTILSL